MMVKNGVDGEKSSKNGIQNEASKGQRPEKGGEAGENGGS
jgi:hypothetical protein